MRVQYRISNYQHFMNCEYWTIFSWVFFRSISIFSKQTSRELLGHAMRVRLGFFSFFVRISPSSHAFGEQSTFSSLLSRFEQISTKWCERLWASHRFINKCNPFAKLRTMNIVDGWFRSVCSVFLFVYLIVYIGRIHDIVSVMQCPQTANISNA